MSQVTTNFNLKEFIKQEDWGYVPEEYLHNLTLLINRLQVVRDIVARPIVVTSGYRNPNHNRRVGGRPNSYHLRGMAVDIVVRRQDPRDTQKLLKGWSGGMGCYNSFTHLDIGPKRRWGTNVP